MVNIFTLFFPVSSNHPSCQANSANRALNLSGKSAEKTNTLINIAGLILGLGIVSVVIVFILNELGYDVRDAGAYNKGSVDYPDFAHEVARLVSTGKAWRGIMIDGAGIGSCIVANKVPGIRAGMAYDYSSAVNSREHNDTNVLTLGAGMIGINLAKQIVKTWLTTEFGGGRHTARIDKISAVEKQYLK